MGAVGGAEDKSWIAELFEEDTPTQIRYGLASNLHYLTLTRGGAQCGDRLPSFGPVGCLAASLDGFRPSPE